MPPVLGLFQEAWAWTVAPNPRPHVLKGPEKKMSGAHSSQTASSETMSVLLPLPENAGVTDWVAADAAPDTSPSISRASPVTRIVRKTLLRLPTRMSSPPLLGNGCPGRMSRPVAIDDRLSEEEGHRTRRSSKRGRP